MLKSKVFAAIAILALAGASSGCSPSNCPNVVAGSSFIGQGYNILMGNGLLDSDTDGFRGVPMVHFTECGEMSYKKITVSEQNNCESSGTVSSIDSAKQWQTQRSSSISLSVGVPDVFSFGASTAMKDANSMTYTSNDQIYTASTTCSVLQLQLQFIVVAGTQTYPFCDTFILAIKELSGKPQEDFFQFFKTYGTHMIIGGTVGSSETVLRTISAYNVADGTSTGVNIKVSASASFDADGVPVNVGGSVGGSTSSSSANSFASKFSNYQKFTVGDPPPDENKFDTTKWIENSKKNGALLKVRLIQISTMLVDYLTPFWGTDLADLKDIQTNMGKAFKDYCKSEQAKDSTVLCDPLSLTLSKYEIYQAPTTQCPPGRALLSCGGHLDSYPSKDIYRNSVCHGSTTSSPKIVCINDQYDILYVESDNAWPQVTSFTNNGVYNMNSATCKEDYYVIGCNGVLPDYIPNQPFNDGINIFSSGATITGLHTCQCQNTVKCVATCMHKKHITGITISTDMGSQPQCPSQSLALGFAYMSTFVTSKGQTLSSPDDFAAGVSAVNQADCRSNTNNVFGNIYEAEAEGLVPDGTTTTSCTVICGTINPINEVAQGSASPVVQATVVLTPSAAQRSARDSELLPGTPVVHVLAQSWIEGMSVDTGRYLSVSVAQNDDAAYLSLKFPVSQGTKVEDVAADFENALRDGSLDEFKGLAKESGFDVHENRTLASIEYDEVSQVETAQLCPPVKETNYCCKAGATQCDVAVVDCVAAFDPICKDGIWDDQCVQESQQACGVEC